MSVIVEMALFPLDKGESMSPYVARVLGVVRASGLPHVLGPMGTCVEGEWPEVWGLVDACFRELEKDCGRVYLAVKADWRRGRTGGLGGKTASVAARLAQEGA